MNNSHLLSELRGMKRGDEMREKFLLYSVQRILSEKKRQSFFHKFFKTKKKNLIAKWS